MSDSFMFYYLSNPFNKLRGSPILPKSFPADAATPTEWALYLQERGQLGSAPEVK